MVNDLTVAALTVTSDQAPRVEILFEAAAEDIASVTVSRTVDGVTLNVPGAIGRAISGALSVVDFDVPFNRVVQYRAEMFSDVGYSIGFSDPASLTVASADTWMHNPLDPEGAVRVTFLDSAGQSVSRPVPGSIVYPKGRRLGVMISEPRRGVQGVVLDVYCTDYNAADKVQAFLGTQIDTVPVICVRIGAKHPIRIPQPFYVGVLDIQEEDRSRHTSQPLLLERITGSEVARPAPGIFIPLLTRADLNAYYATRAALNADHASRLDVNRFYEIAGFAEA